MVVVRAGLVERSAERGEKEHGLIDHREVHPVLDLGPPPPGHDQLGRTQSAQMTRQRRSADTHRLRNVGHPDVVAIAQVGEHGTAGRMPQCREHTCFAYSRHDEIIHPESLPRVVPLGRMIPTALAHAEHRLGCPQDAYR
ncbi:hypothetical protein SDC9_95890 [bioreactor metagenome]|uniref:Uncharacterized protein n=1 Tax=bioreactor metagenome TaxID=1076179 RepID=A0A645A7S0_9ZZZZ